MAEQQGNTTIGTNMDLQEATVQAFKTSLRGALLCPGDDGYDAARTVYNTAIDRRPALIAPCAGAADVMADVHFARAHNLLVSVRGGGHNVAANAVCDSPLMSSPPTADCSPRATPSTRTFSGDCAGAAGTSAS
jgi:hypothetical protein